MKEVLSHVRTHGIWTKTKRKRHKVLFKMRKTVDTWFTESPHKSGRLLGDVGGGSCLFDIGGLEAGRTYRLAELASLAFFSEVLQAQTLSSGSSYTLDLAYLYPDKTPSGGVPCGLPVTAAVTWWLFYSADFHVSLSLVQRMLSGVFSSLQPPSHPRHTGSL